MNNSIKNMLEPYKCHTPQDYKNAFKEIIQEISLLGLSRQHFFANAAFYGGTAMRLSHGLNRFSEDLDFTLLKKDNHFDIENYLQGIKKELSFYDLHADVEKKLKTVDTSIESAFLKTNTIEILLKIEGNENKKIQINKNDKIQVKIEIDTEPPLFSGNTELKYATLPIPFSYKILTLPSLFSGKLHAILCRKYKSGRIKGRDYYDFIWFINNKVTIDMHYLKSKLVQSGHIDESRHFDLSTVKNLLTSKFLNLDWENAKQDVLPFIKDPFEVEVWSKDFFVPLINRLQ